MKKAMIIPLISLITIDVLLTAFYYRDSSLKFNSEEFNNIGSPITSFLGFIGLIITVKIAIVQFRLQHSTGYFDYYGNVINKILQENTDTNNIMELL